MEITFVYIGEPVPAARVRVTRNGTFTPAKYRDYKRAFSAALRGFLYKQYATTTHDVHIKASFYRKNNIRVDIDNLFKGLADSLVDAGILLDDSQIVSCELEKLVDRDNPRVEFSITTR
jgi:Holliday junction resolvase RusA-like endonuclease